MKTTWNPWHGCYKISEGCQNCYMYYLDAQRGQNGANFYKVKGKFDYPLQKDKNKNYKIKSGEFVSVCLTSDFFLEQADEFRKQAWQMIKIRPDVVFILITKRISRINSCLSSDWGEGFENVWLNVTCENQRRADERLPILLDLPFKHKGVIVEPFISEISILKYLQSGQIQNVWAGGENYLNARPLFYEWVKKLSDECKKSDVEFVFFDTGKIFVKNGKSMIFTNKQERQRAAKLLNLDYKSTKSKNFNIKTDLF